MGSENDEYSEWFAYGLANGWISEVFDLNTEGAPISETEYYGDPEIVQIPCVRMYGPRYFNLLKT